jgi:ATP-dependent Lon protease
VEVVPMKGKGKLTLTGSLGEVMRESATTALSYIRNHAHLFGLKEDFFEFLDLHVHIPEGAVPKEGPSAGITLMAAILSSLTGIPARTDVAMTGEMTLTGDVLPVGGLNEKLLAAKRLGITEIVVPEKNRKDIAELQPDLLDGLNLQYVQTISDVLKLVLTSTPIKAGAARMRKSISSLA